VLWLCFAGIFGFEVKVQNAENNMPTIVCSSNITEEMAYIDWKTDVNERSGEFNCFCNDIYNNEGYSAMGDFVFQLDPTSEKPCHDWWHWYWSVKFTTTVIPGLMGCINIVIELSVRFGTHFIKKPTNET
jgi:hypothetical protein